MPKKIIYWGQSTLWDSDIPRAISSGDQPPPFNGVTVFLSFQRAADDSLYQRVWDSSSEFRFTDAERDVSWSQVKRLSELGYTDNFVALNVGGGRFADCRSWWDGTVESKQAFSVVLEHVYQGAYVAGRGGCRGIVCDMEELGSFPFSFHDFLKNDGKDPDPIDVKYKRFRSGVAALGINYIRAIQDGFNAGRVAGRQAGDADPGDELVIVLDRVFYTLNLDLGLRYCASGDSYCAWANSNVTVWLSFLNGMIEGAGMNTTFIDACESESYGVYGSTGRKMENPSFAAIRQEWLLTNSYSDALYTGPIRQTYEKQSKLGFIFWFLGGPSEKSDGETCHDPIDSKPVDHTKPPKGDGHFDKLEMLGTDALKSSDSYLFIYTQQDYGFFPSRGNATNVVPAEYMNVLAKLKSLAAQG